MSRLFEGGSGASSRDVFTSAADDSSMPSDGSRDANNRGIALTTTSRGGGGTNSAHKSNDGYKDDSQNYSRGDDYGERSPGSPPKYSRSRAPSQYSSQAELLFTRSRAPSIQSPSPYDPQIESIFTRSSRAPSMQSQYDPQTESYTRNRSSSLQSQAGGRSQFGGRSRSSSFEVVVDMERDGDGPLKMIDPMFPEKELFVVSKAEILKLSEEENSNNKKKHFKQDANTFNPNPEDAKKWFAPDSIELTYDPKITDKTLRYQTRHFSTKLFLILEHPNCCQLARWIHNFIGALIIITVSSFVVSSLPPLQHQPDTCSDPVCDNDPDLCPSRVVCAPVQKLDFNVIDITCAYIFAIELVIRLLLCWTVEPRIADIITKDEDEKKRISYIENLQKNLRSAEDHFIEMFFDYVVEDPRDSAKEDKIKTIVESLENDPTKEDEVKKLFEHFDYSKPQYVDPHISAPMRLVRYVFFPSTMVWVDILAIIPAFVSHYWTGQSVTLSIFRILRVFRILKIYNISEYAGESNRLLTETLWKAKEPIFFQLLYMTVIVTLMGSLVYLVESGDFKVTVDHPNGAYFRRSLEQGVDLITPYDSIPVSIYWAVITLTTVGYGDLAPITVFGRIFSIIIALCGVTVIGMLSSIIGNKYNEIYNSYELQQCRAEKNGSGGKRLKKRGRLDRTFSFFFGGEFGHEEEREKHHNHRKNSTFDVNDENVKNNSNNNTLSSSNNVNTDASSSDFKALTEEEKLRSEALSRFLDMNREQRFKAYSDLYDRVMFLERTKPAPNTLQRFLESPQFLDFLHSDDIYKQYSKFGIADKEEKYAAMHKANQLLNEEIAYHKWQANKLADAFRNIGSSSDEEHDFSNKSPLDLCIATMNKYKEITNIFEGFKHENEDVKYRDLMKACLEASLRDNSHVSSLDNSSENKSHD